MTERAKLSDLQPDQNNANRGTERGRALLEKSLRNYGAGRSILLDKHGKIIAGNKTAETAAEIGLDDVLIVRTDGRQLVAVMREDLDLDSEEARMLAYADNRVGQVSLDFDPDVMGADLAAGLPLEEFWQPFELEEIGAAKPDPTKDGDAEPQISRADELQKEWGTELGQLWRLPSRTPGQEHRLICGDCTDADVVARVMGGEKAVLMVTDPPYGIDHDTSWREEAGISIMGEQSAKGIEWDSNDNWSTAYALSGAGIAFVWHASSHNIVVAQSLIDAGYEVKQMIIWNKNVAPFGRSHYSYKHEPCWYAVKRGKTANWHGPNNEVTVWDTASPRHIMGGSDEEKTPHPTQKPIMLYVRPIGNHTQAGDVAYEPFCGSGTAIIAAENLARQCRAVEISPAYVAVALQRYKDAFGIEPELVH